MTKNDNNNGKNNYSKVEKDIADSIQSKDLSRIEKNGYAIEQMPQSSNYSREKRTLRNCLFEVRE
jgi:hypothetical protein